MKVVSQKEIKVKSKTYELVKKPKPDNQDSDKVSISEGELSPITVNDKLKLKVLNTDDSVKAERTYTYQELQKKLRRSRNGRYSLLRY